MGGGRKRGERESVDLDRMDEEEEAARRKVNGLSPLDIGDSGRM